MQVLTFVYSSSVLILGGLARHHDERSANGYISSLERVLSDYDRFSGCMETAVHEEEVSMKNMTPDELFHAKG